jgi:hypothetical protein
MAAPSTRIRLYARVGAALIAARDNKQDAFDAITAAIPWDRFLASVEEAEALAQSEEFDAYQMRGEHYAGIRRWAPTFLDAFVFQGVCRLRLRSSASADQGGRAPAARRLLLPPVKRAPFLDRRSGRLLG